MSENELVWIVYWAGFVVGGVTVVFASAIRNGVETLHNLWRGRRV